MPEMIAGARAFIDAPSVTPLGGGVLSVANVVNTNGHELMGAQFQSDACADVEEWTEWCTMNPVAAKLFEDGYDLVEGDPFALYAGIACDFQRLDEAKARAEHRLDYVEGRGVDRHVLAELETAAADIGGPFPVTEAIGLAEAYAATIYGGVPTLVIPRSLIPCAASQGAIKADAAGLVTVQGSRVANVTTDVATPPAETQTIYVTGQITLLRGSVQSFSVPQLVHDDGTFDPMRALAERVYVPLFECLVAKVEASCS